MHNISGGKREIRANGLWISLWSSPPKFGVGAKVADSADGIVSVNSDLSISTSSIPIANVSWITLARMYMQDSERGVNLSTLCLQSCCRGSRSPKNALWVHAKLADICFLTPLFSRIYFQLVIYGSTMDREKAGSSCLVPTTRRANSRVNIDLRNVWNFNTESPGMISFWAEVDYQRVYNIQFLISSLLSHHLHCRVFKAPLRKMDLVPSPRNRGPLEQALIAPAEGNTTIKLVH